MSYNPQTNGQVQQDRNYQILVSNKEVKNILKKIIRPAGKDEVHKLPDALYVYQTAYKTPIGMSPFQPRDYHASMASN